VCLRTKTLLNNYCVTPVTPIRNWPAIELKKIAKVEFGRIGDYRLFLICYSSTALSGRKH